MDINVPDQSSTPPAQTTEFTVDVNLDAGAAINDTYSTTLIAYDSLGNSIPVTVTFEKMAEYWSGDIVGELDTASEELRAKFAELFDMYVTVHPKTSSEGYRFDITANIPLEMEGNTVSAYDISDLSSLFNPSPNSTSNHIFSIVGVSCHDHNSLTRPIMLHIFE